MIWLAAASYVGLLTVVAFWVRSHAAHERRIDRLLELAATERATVEHARSQATPDLAELVSLVDRLCQRIQAPELAVIDHQNATGLPYLPAAVNPEGDDEEFWKAHGITKEMLAQQAMDEELALQQAPVNG